MVGLDKLFKFQLKSRYLVTAVDTWTILVPCHTFGGIKWSNADYKKITENLEY